MKLEVKPLEKLAEENRLSKELAESLSEEASQAGATIFTGTPESGVDYFNWATTLSRLNVESDLEAANEVDRAEGFSSEETLILEDMFAEMLLNGGESIWVKSVEENSAEIVIQNSFCRPVQTTLYAESSSEALERLDNLSDPVEVSKAVRMIVHIENGEVAEVIRINANSGKREITQTYSR